MIGVDLKDFSDYALLCGLSWFECLFGLDLRVSLFLVCERVAMLVFLCRLVYGGNIVSPSSKSRPSTSLLASEPIQKQIQSEGSYSEKGIRNGIADHR